MNLGIEGKKVIVCVLFKGFGKVCVLFFVKEGVSVIVNGCDFD